MKFLIDANLPPSLALWLGTDGHEAIYVDDVLPPSSPDEAIWAIAAEQAFVVISKDADFAIRAERDDRVQVVWVRCGNLKLAELALWFEARRNAMIALLTLRERVVELR